MKYNPCTSREMAERLKKAGYPERDISEENTGFFWAVTFDSENEMVYTDAELYLIEPECIKNSVYAPTVTELLPDGWYLKRYWDERPDGTEIEGWEAMNTDAGIFFLDENPHDAAAMAWLWEKENGQ
jgi:hypothetical protein